MTESDAAQAFSRLAGDLAAPMMIVTVAAGGQRSGCLVGFATQASIDPPRFLVCLSRRNHTYQVASAHRATTLAVHFLAPEHHALAELFGSETGDRSDKMSRCAWRHGPAGAVILKDCDHWFVGAIVARLTGLGDHVGFLLEPIAAKLGDGRAGGLTLQDVSDLEPGHEA